MELKVALIGCGNVGRGLLELAVSRAEELRTSHGLSIKITAIADLIRGSVYDPEGLDAKAVLNCLDKSGKLEGIECPEKGWDSIRTIVESNADVVAEMSYTDIQTGEPATDHILKALESGKHVATSNKGPIALHYDKLMTAAEANSVMLRFEGTVMSGTPVINLARHCLAGCKVQEIRGILNGTTNYIITEMEKGASYEDALKHAQRLGFAEAKPDADVSGTDAATKLIILSKVLMNKQINLSDISCTGITGLTLEEIQGAINEGYRYKLIASLKKDKNDIIASVKPSKIPMSDPLAGISGTTNALTFVTDILGETTIVGTGAGKLPTGYAILADIIDIHDKVVLHS